MSYTDEEWLAFEYTLKELCRVVNRNVQYIKMCGNRYEVAIAYYDRQKYVDVSTCSDFRMIAIEVLKYINGVD